MIPISIAEVLSVTQGQLLHGDISKGFTGYATDSRTVRPGDLYIPIVGERFDGNDFIADVIGKGAAWSLVSDLSKIPLNEDLDGKGLIFVHDTLTALQELAAYILKKSNVPVIAVTGSTGKTTTKEMLASVLETQFKVLRNEGNLNNHIGLPLTCLQLQEDHQLAVLEMGMNHRGELARLAEITRPVCGVITNIGLSHIENLGSQRGIFEAKMEIAGGMTSEHILFVNGDDEFLAGVESDTFHVKKVGFGDSCDCRIDACRLDGVRGSEFSFAWPDKIPDALQCRLTVPGRHNIQNAALAAAVGLHFGISPENIRAGLLQCRNTGMRLNFIETAGKLTLINDAYNASPASVKAALQVLESMEAERKIAVLSDMLEMGHEAENGHRMVGRAVQESGIDYLFTTGHHAAWIAEEAVAMGMEPEQVCHFETKELLIDRLRSLVSAGDAVLIKGSRSMKMERVAEALQEVQ